MIIKIKIIMAKKKCSEQAIFLTHSCQRNMAKWKAKIDHFKKIHLLILVYYILNIKINQIE